MTYATSGSGQVTPVITEQDISSNDGLSSILISIGFGNTCTVIVLLNGVSPFAVLVTLILIVVLPLYFNASNSALFPVWTNDGVNIEYNYNGDNGLDIPLHVEKPGNRNYNKAEADGMMHIMGFLDIDR